MTKRYYQSLPGEELGNFRRVVILMIIHGILSTSVFRQLPGRQTFGLTDADYSQSLFIKLPTFAVLGAIRLVVNDYCFKISK